MSRDTRDKLAVEQDALLQTMIAMNEWRRLATSFFDPVASLPVGKSTPLTTKIHTVYPYSFDAFDRHVLALG